MRVSCENYIILGDYFCISYKGGKAFCTIGGFEVTLNLISDRFFFLEVPYTASVKVRQALY